MKQNTTPRSNGRVSRFAPHEDVLRTLVLANPGAGSGKIAGMVKRDNRLGPLLKLDNLQQFRCHKSDLQTRLLPWRGGNPTKAATAKTPRAARNGRVEHVTLPAVHYCPKCGTDMIAVATAMVMAGVTE